MNEQDKLLGINNYCQTKHTMNEKVKKFALKSYKLVQKSLFYETFCLTQDKNFKYELLTRE